MRLPDELFKVPYQTVAGMDSKVIGDIISVILKRGRVKRQQPERRNAKAFQII